MGTDLEKGSPHSLTITKRDNDTDSSSPTSQSPPMKPVREKTDGASTTDTDSDDDDDDVTPPPLESGGVLSRTISRLTRQSTNYDPGPPPDGGVKAWTAVFCAHLVITNTWGIINSFGVFQPYYTTTLSRPPSDISWVGSVQIFLLFFIGAITGRLTDAGFFRHIFALGTVLLLLGTFTVSVASTYTQVFLSQGICMGLGMGCLFCPSISTVSTYFDKRRAIALAVAACGSATGGLIFPSMVRELLPKVGFGWTMRSIGLIQLVTLGVGCVFLKPRIKPRKSGPLIDLAAWKEGEYVLYALGAFTCFIGLYFPFYYVASFSRDIIGLEFTESLNLLLVMNGVGTIGRLGPNAVADRVGPLKVFVPVAGLCGVCVICWMAVKDVAGLYAWSCFYGMVAGGIQSLFPAGLSSLNTDVRKAGVRIGMVFTTVSFATLAGPPIAGAIITACGGDYWGAQIFAGTTLLIGMGLVAASFVIKSRKVMAETGATSMWSVKA
ncbi:major facilitator superfamily domain-containing protein [Cercophora samala]|uniref:Major facilitator superfamily domain-containing protein n=1 Tax=Cercophora samala TaxID=330535 RepID=A0AA40DAZ1_9PEZI|nr:major facilitator superfamily domain-containing protein [Cercophora samala]